jgi:hypothetical protein
MQYHPTQHSGMLKSAKSSFLFDHPFWAQPKSWPHDSPGYVFLAQAFHDIGSATYHDGWVQPPRVNEPDEPEDPADDAGEEAWEMHDQEYERYENACEEARANCEDMWANVAQKIAIACKDGTLGSAIRAKEGGEFIKLKDHHWNTENFTTRFFRCDMSRSYPFAEDRLRGSHWIYVTRDSLENYLGKSPAADAVMQSETCGGSRQAATDISSRRSSLTATKEEIREVANKIYADPVNDRPNMNKAWDLIKKELTNARRNRVFEVLRGEAFAKQRRDAGNQSKEAVSKRI